MTSTSTNSNYLCSKLTQFKRRRLTPERIRSRRGTGVGGQLSKMTLTCCASSSVFIVLVLLHQTPQFNCQIQAQQQHQYQQINTNQSPDIQMNVGMSDEPMDEQLPCTRNRNRQLSHSNHQPHGSHSARHQQLRQQRQFRGNANADSAAGQQASGRAAQLVAANEALQAEVTQRSNSNNIDNHQVQPEEFSLTSSTTTTTGSTSTAQSSQGQGQRQAPVYVQSKPEAESANITPSLPNEPLNSPVVPQPQPTTTSSSVSASTQTQQQPQPPVTTATTALANPTGETLNLESSNANVTSANVKPQATSRRIEEDATAMKGNSIGHQSMNSNNGERELFSTSGQQQKPQDEVDSNFERRIGSLAQSMSSSPSSISIITPLMGPPNQQQQQQQQPQHHTAQVSAAIGGGSQQSSQQSAMMKPIYVVGNPISEPEYNAGYDQQSQQHLTSNEIAATSSANISKASKGLDLPVGGQANTRQQVVANGSGRSEKKIVNSMMEHQQHQSGISTEAAIANATSGSSSSAPASSLGSMGGERMSGPTLIYSDGQLTSSSMVPQVATPVTSGTSSSVSSSTQASILQVGPSATDMSSASGSSNQPAQGVNLENQQPHHTGPPAPRLFQGGAGGQGGAAVQNNNPRRPSLPPPMNQANAASGFRSPLSPSGPLVANQQQQQQQQQAPVLQPPINANTMAASMNQQQPNFYQSSPPYASANGNPFGLAPNSMASMFNNAQLSNLAVVNGGSQQQGAFLSTIQQAPAQAIQAPQVPSPAPGAAPGTGYSGRRPLNITRVERKYHLF